MLSNRSLLIAAACVLPLSVVACGGGDDDDSPIIPEGTHYGYVVNNATAVPGLGHQSTDFGLDLGGPKTAKLDGRAENKFGDVLGTLTLAGVDVQGSIDDAINEGGIILLLDVQTKDFMNSAAAGFGLKFGANPVPDACTTPTDCGHHLDGHGSFSIAADSPSDPLLGGKIVNGTFNGGPGDISLQISLGGGLGIPLDLVHARAKVTGITDTGLTAIIGGLLTVSDLTTKVGPAIQQLVEGIIATQCTGSPPPLCGCLDPTIRGIIDGIDADDNCEVTAEEILSFPLVRDALSPDGCSKDSCTASDALSVGVQVTAVKATFPL